MFEFSVGGCEYQSRPIPVIQQFNIVRRLGPVLAKLANNMSIISAAREDLDNGKTNPLAAAAPMIEAISDLSDADCTYIIDICMGACMRKQAAGQWVGIWNSTAKRAMFEDINLMQTLEIVGTVLMKELSGFLDEPAPKA